MHTQPATKSLTHGCLLRTNQRYCGRPQAVDMGFSVRSISLRPVAARRSGGLGPQRLQVKGSRRARSTPRVSHPGHRVRCTGEAETIGFSCPPFERSPAHEQTVSIRSRRPCADRRGLLARPATAARRLGVLDCADAGRPPMAARTWPDACHGRRLDEPARRHLGVRIATAPCVEHRVGSALAVVAHRGSLRDGHRHWQARDRGRASRGRHAGPGTQGAVGSGA